MVTRTAVYAVGLEVLTAITDPEVDRLIDLAASRIGFPDPPSFDFTWRVSEGDVVVGQGPGESGATGLVITGDGRGGQFAGMEVERAPSDAWTQRDAEAQRGGPALWNI